MSYLLNLIKTRNPKHLLWCFPDKLPPGSFPHRLVVSLVDRGGTGNCQGVGARGRAGWGRPAHIRQHRRFLSARAGVGSSADLTLKLEFTKTTWWWWLPWTWICWWLSSKVELGWESGDSPDDLPARTFFLISCQWPEGREQYFNKVLSTMESNLWENDSLW